MRVVSLPNITPQLQVVEVLVVCPLEVAGLKTSEVFAKHPEAQ
jgi:hypothetical protein